MTLKILIVEDDFASRKVMNAQLKLYGNCDTAVNGKEAVNAFREAIEEGQRYDLICLDIMMPEMNGHEALKKIREIELKNGIYGFEGVKIIMTTALADSKNVMEAFKEQCEGYLVKPVRKEKLIELLQTLGFDI